MGMSDDRAARQAQNPNSLLDPEVIVKRTKRRLEELEVGLNADHPWLDPDPHLRIFEDQKP
ncbi:hypothetical protein DICSQDRAFT_174768 [Dichomitus squalens LYAD-421 SS1]|uniref:Uncharacterized protein n=1 Tax=Dichomitus squalens (strain LYAD-421) TaxID=732165 RepID=R7SLD2_DICSQ|nr:uncharacterized protein DICSQDRAFT_174768 [Dichomitus squalens LYAD-421 SS1]EJF56540.1 hypothetical protein DICSQDRAFT_174768 [Dichomitus squalens LYAD-421 SS1]